MIGDIARQCIRKRKDYIPGKPVEEVQRELNLTDIVKMASNENPLGTSPKAVEAMIREIQTNANRYPESLCTALAGKLAEKLGVKPAQLFFDNGGDGVITMIGMTFINPDDETVTSELTFPAYDNITTKMNGRTITVPLAANGGIDLNGFLKAISPKTKLIFICNPNNPTGRIVGKAAMVSFIEKVPSNVVIVLDEAYSDFVDDPDFLPTIPLLTDHPNMIILRTFSKLMGLAGLRCGYTISSEETVKIMMKAREPFPVNRIAQAGALAALDDAGFCEKTIRNNAEGRLQYYSAFEKMGLKYYKTQANFIYVELGTDSEAVFRKMLCDGVIVRPLGPLGRPRSMRITIGLPGENARTIASLKKAMGS
jgi:histidinol-phosphate aminotransferase